MVDLYSHPGGDDREPVVLIDHLRDVARRAEDVVAPEGTAIFSDAPLGEVVGTLGFVHDLGKATTWFQDYIGMRDVPEDGPTQHSPLGAYAAYYALDRRGFQGQVSLAGCVAVYSHHQRLPDVASYVWKHATARGGRGRGSENVETVLALADNVDEHAREFAEEVLETASGGAGCWADFYESLGDGSLFDAVKDQVSRSGLEPDGDPIEPTFYDGLLQVWSALCLADKTAASRTPRTGLEADKPSATILRTHIDGLGQNEAEMSARESELNRQRSEAREDVVETVDELVERGRNVATITLPTGLGKTLTGLDAAMTLRDRTDRDRIVYALPFTSVIDQVAGELQEVYDTDGTDDLLTLHHHLAETVTEVDDTDANAYVQQLLGESWRSGLTVTTYVQLFESLAGPTNAQSLKLPALRDSVVLLDEPQSIPHSWWPLVNRLTDLLTTGYNASVLGMTATQPGFFESDDGGPIELVREPQGYFEGIERIEYEFHDSLRGVVDSTVEPLGYEVAAQRVVDKLDEGDSVLCVCNTIDSARQLSNTIRDETDSVDVGTAFDTSLQDGHAPSVDEIVESVRKSEGEVAHLHLSTRLRPRDRLAFIRAASDLLEDERPLVAVSTQLIEAGVDISFDRVYRDLAPIDSVVQAGGRCNRSFERERGQVTVWRLAPPDEKKLPPSEAVYNRWGESLLNVTWRALESVREEVRPPLSEADVAWRAVNEYFRILRESRDVGKEEYVSLLESAEARELGKLSLIEERNAVDVVVARTPRETDELDAVRSSWNEGRFDQVDQLLDEHRDRQVSVPLYDPDSEEANRLGSLERIHPDANVRRLSTHDDDRGFFDETTGLVVPDGVEHRFL